MRESLVNVLKFNREQLTRNIKITEEFWTMLVKFGTLTSNHVDSCKSRSTNTEKLEHLLDMMERRDDCCFETFCQVLQLTISNLDLVKRLRLEAKSPQISDQLKAEKFTSENVVERLKDLVKENSQMREQLEMESRTYNQLESKNAEIQMQLEEAKRVVQEQEQQHQRNENTFESNGMELNQEKELIKVLEKEKELLETNIGCLEAEFKKKTETKDNLEKQLQTETQENKKLKKQISFQKTHLNSLGSRSRDETDGE